MKVVLWKILDFMTAEYIRQIVEILPSDSPYFQSGVSGQLHPFDISSPVDRLDLALSDPQFGGNLVKAYAASGLPLPTDIEESVLLRAYNFLLNPNARDLNMALAFQIVLPESMAQRDLLRPLLICRDISLRRVAELCSLNPEVVSIFETLFWNCLDRKQERPYIARICQRSGLAGATGAERDRDDLGSQLLRIAFHDGRANFVLVAAGVVTAPQEKLPTNKLYDQIIRGTFASAAVGLAAGSVSKSSNPALELALRIIAARKKQKMTDQKVSKLPGLGESLISSFNEVVPSCESADQSEFPDVLPPPPNQKT